ncbi:MAG: hypothetical protein KGZ59_12445 [Chitinophagaceae bacterium]|nr:hypothetical protein [Chitinophagaceae bacterium]
MRKYLCIGFAIIFTFKVNAQHYNESSQEIVNQFKKDYPHLIKVDWLKKDSLLIASYTENNIPIKKAFNLMGNLIYTQLEIDESFLPKSSYDYIARFFKTDRIAKAYKIFINSTINYWVVVKEQNICFDIDGNFIKANSLSIPH